MTQPSAPSIVKRRRSRITLGADQHSPGNLGFTAAGILTLQFATHGRIFTTGVFSGAFAAAFTDNQCVPLPKLPTATFQNFGTFHCPINWRAHQL